MYRDYADRDKSYRLADIIFRHKVFRMYAIEDRYNSRCYNKVVVGCDELIGPKLNLTIFSNDYKNVVRLDPRYVPNSHGENILPEYLAYSDIDIDDWTYSDIDKIVERIRIEAKKYA